MLLKVRRPRKRPPFLRRKGYRKGRRTAVETCFGPPGKRLRALFALPEEKSRHPRGRHRSRGAHFPRKHRRGQRPRRCHRRSDRSFRWPLHLGRQLPWGREADSRREARKGHRKEMLSSLEPPLRRGERIDRPRRGCRRGKREAGSSHQREKEESRIGTSLRRSRPPRGLILKRIER